MAPEVIKISGMANSYLVKGESGGYVLIDTGLSWNRASVEKALDAAGCQPGNLNLIVLTHGDQDHVGNAAYLRHKYGAKVAMHRDDLGRVEQGDMSWNRKTGGLATTLFKLPFFKLSKSNRFTPDLFLEDGQDLSEYGLDAKILHLPGHSSGSISILTGSGELFCGDLFENRSRPALNSIMDDKSAAQASLAKLKSLRVGTVYPGHGQPFPFDRLISPSLQGRGLGDRSD